MSTISSSTTSTTAFGVTADTTGALVIQTGATPTTALTIDTGQRSTFPTTIGIGGATPSTSGAGISFPATQSASSDANTLDDYEKKTWTATDASGAGLTLTSNFTGYVKVGRQVTVCGQVNWPTTANTTAVSIGGLPFTSISSMRFAIGIYTSQGNAITILLTSSTTSFGLRNNLGVDYTNANMSGSPIIFSFTYFV